MLHRKVTPTNTLHTKSLREPKATAVCHKPLTIRSVVIDSLVGRFRRPAYVAFGIVHSGNFPVVDAALVADRHRLVGQTFLQNSIRQYQNRLLILVLPWFLVPSLLRHQVIEPVRFLRKLRTHGVHRALHALLTKRRCFWWKTETYEFYGREKGEELKPFAFFTEVGPAQRHLPARKWCGEGDFWRRRGRFSHFSAYLTGSTPRGFDRFLVLYARAKAVVTTPSRIRRSYDLMKWAYREDAALS